MTSGWSVTLRRMLVGLMALVAILILPSTASATEDGNPDTGYSFVDSESPLGPATGQWLEISQLGAAADFTAAGADDGLFPQPPATTAPLPIGFGFIFFGQEYSRLRICANGYFTFGVDSAAFDNQPIPTVGLPETSIFPFWDDLFLPLAGNTVFTFVLGNAPAVGTVGSRQFIIEWLNVAFFADQAGQLNSLSFQVVLFEGSNDIEFRYKDVRGPLGRGDSATVGLEDETGTHGNQYEFNGTPNSNHIFSGLVIHWTSFSQSVPLVNIAGVGGVGVYRGTQNDERQRHGNGTHLCFVTNAAYGSNLADEVRVLCRFRDVFLMGSGPGRDFVDFYYRSSPPLADLIGSEEGLKLPLQMALRPPIWFASFMLFSTAAEKAAVAALVLVLGMVLGRAMCRRLAEPEA